MHLPYKDSKSGDTDDGRGRSDDEIRPSRPRRGGFPTGIKWKTVADAPADRRYVVCNFDEGDSGTFADRMIVEGDPYALIEGMTICAVAIGATKGYVYCRSEYPHAAKTFSEALVLARQAGYLGSDVMGSGLSFDIEIRMGAGAYVRRGDRPSRKPRRQARRRSRQAASAGA